MTSELRQALELPEIAPPDRGEFGQEFRKSIAGLNEQLQLLAAQGNPTDYRHFDTQRQTLYAAYQKAIGDSAQTSKLLEAVGKVHEKASANVASLSAARTQWEARQADFDMALVQIQELSDAGNPKAGAFVKVGDAIRSRVKNRDYRNATAALDQLLPKLGEEHTQHVGQGGGSVETLSKAKTDVDPLAKTQPGGSVDPLGKTDPDGSVNPLGKTQEAPSADWGSAKTQAAPADPPKKPLGGTVAESQPPAPPPRKQGSNGVRDLTQSEIDAENKRVQGYKPKDFKPSPGDGKEIPLKKVFARMEKKDPFVTISGSDEHHRRIWHEWLGKDPKSKPPLAFQAGGRVRVNIEKLTPDDRAKFIKLDKLRDPDSYRPSTGQPTGTDNPKQGSGGGGGKTPVDPMAKTPVDPLGKTPPAGTPQAPPSKPQSGDGKPVSMDEVFRRMQKKDPMVTESGSDAHHRRIWYDWLKKDPKSKPPVAFEYGGRVRVNIDALSEADRAKYVELDKLRNPSAYPKTAPPTGTGGSSGGQNGGKSTGQNDAPTSKAPQPSSPDAPKSGTASKGKVTVNYDFTGNNKDIKVKRINLNDYPADKPGKITGFFKDRPVLKGLAQSGASFGASAVSGAILDKVRSHYSGAVAEAEKAFNQVYPLAGDLEYDAAIDGHAETYRQVMDYISDPANAVHIKDTRNDLFLNNLEGAFDYETAMIDLMTKVEQLTAGLPELAADIDARSQVLYDIAHNFEEVFIWIHTHVVGSIPFVYYESFTFWHLRDVFRSLGSTVGNFAGTIKMRHRDYEKLSAKLDKTLIKIGAELDPWREMYALKKH